MKLKFIAAATAALIAGAAQADQLAPVSVGPTFNDVVIGTISVTSLSNLSGYIFAADSVNSTIGSTNFSFTLQSVVFTNASVGSLVDTDLSVTGFAFSNVTAGDYIVKASGYLTGAAQIPGTGFIGAEYTATAVTAVPEPGSYALMAAGLGLMGFIARRRKPA